MYRAKVRMGASGWGPQMGPADGYGGRTTRSGSHLKRPSLRFMPTPLARALIFQAPGQEKACQPIANQQPNSLDRRRCQASPKAVPSRTPGPITISSPRPSSLSWATDAPVSARSAFFLARRSCQVVDLVGLPFPMSCMSLLCVMYVGLVR